MHSLLSYMNYFDLIGREVVDKNKSVLSNDETTP